jgi:hypothetical protein
MLKKDSKIFHEDTNKRLPVKSQGDKKREKER